MANKILWYIVILAGIFPFLVPLYKGVVAATVEFSSSFSSSLFIGEIVSYSIEHWLTYIMGILLVLIGLKHLKIK